MKDVVYYAEHRRDESRYLRSRRAADMSPFSVRADWETGVIVDPSGEGPLWIRALARQSSQRRGAAALVALGRAMGSTGVRPS